MASLFTFPINTVFAEQFGRPDATVSNTDWSISGAATAHEATNEAIADGDTSFISATSTTADITLSLSSLNDPETSSSHIIKVVAKSIVSGQGGQPEQIQFSLLQGSTVIATSSPKSVNRGSYTALTESLTSQQANSITDYSNLSVKIVVNNIQNNEEIRVTQVEFEIPDVGGDTSGPKTKNANKSEKQLGSPGNPGKFGSKGNNLGNPGIGNKATIDFSSTLNDQKDVLPFGQLKKLDLVLGIDLTQDLIFDIDLLGDVPADVPAPPAKTIALFLDIVTSVDLSDVSNFQESPQIDFLIDIDLDADERFADGCPVIEVYFLNEDTGVWEKVDDATRDPATDVLGPDGEILQCEYTAVLPHFSKFSVGGVKKPTSSGGGTAAYEIVDTREPSIIEYYWKPELPSAGSSVTVNARILDDVAVKDSVVFYHGADEGVNDAHLITMNKLNGDWYAIDIPDSDVNAPNISFWIVAVDYAGNSAQTETVTVKVQEAKSVSEQKASTKNLPAHVVEAMKSKSVEPVEKLEIVSLKSGDKITSFNDKIIIKNVGERMVDNIRITLSPEIYNSFRLSTSAISSIEPNSNATITFELIGNPNKDMFGEFSYSGEVVVTAEHHSPILLPVNIGEEGSEYLDKNYLNMVSGLSTQRYNKIWLVNSALSKQPEMQHNYYVTTSNGNAVITNAEDELIVKNLSDKTLVNVRLISNVGHAFLLEKKVIPYLEPHDQISIKLIPKFYSEKYSPKDIKGELLVVPSNDKPIQIRINILGTEPENSMNEFVANPISNNNMITTAVEQIKIKNVGDRLMDSVKIMLTNNLDRIFSVNDNLFRHIEPDEEVIVELKYNVKI